MKKDFKIFGPNWEMLVIVLSAISREIIRPLLIVVCLLSNFFVAAAGAQIYNFPQIGYIWTTYCTKDSKDKVDSYALF